MTMPSGGLNCYAKWNRIQYALEYELDGGFLPEGQMNPEGYNVESDEFTLINPTKEGYTFLGWKEAGSNKVSENVTIAKGTTGDKSYTAQWFVNQYEITFELENGEDAIINKQDYGTAVTAPEAPTKTGYTFAGWSPELPDTMPAKNITITATWDAIPYQVAFDGNGATSGMMENQAFVYDLAQKLTKNAFGRAYVVNYDYNEGVAGEPTATATAEFKGWSVSKEAASVYGDEASVKNLASEKDAVATLYANWTLGKVTLPTPTREGYDFAGWTTDKAGEGTLYNGTYTPEADTTLYAQWEGKEYVAYFMKTADDENPQTITKKIGEKLCGKNELLPVPSGIKGYKFEGWYTKDGEQAQTSTIMPLNGVTYYAKWTPRTYQVDFFANYGDDTEAYNYKQVGYERPLGTLPTIERTGYTFDGWFTERVGGTQITPETTMPFEGADYYAQWTPIEYTITYDLDEELVGTGAALPDGTPRSYNIETEEFTLTHPTVEGYTFIGWTGDDIKDPQMNVTISKGTINDKHYTANWKINKHTVTYNALDGSEAETITLEYGQKIPKNELGETVSHTFGGWYITLPTEGNEGVQMPVNMPDKDLDVYANWIEKKEVTLEFDSAGASAVEPQTGYVGAPLTLPADPARSGYTFLGWYNEAGENVSEKENPRYPFDSETYTAKWDVNEYSITYSLNGGVLEDGQENLETYTIETPDFTLHNPTRAGYKFRGWTGSNGRTPSETVTVKTDRISDLAYIANWDALQFTASFDANCDELDNPTSITKDCDAPLGELPELERRGYTFNGWYDAEGDKISSKTTMPAENVTYTAKWTANTYKITYDAKGGEGAPREQKWTYAQEESIFLSDNRPTKAGYYFIGWSEDKAATDADYGSDEEIESTRWAEDVTLYAVWGITTYGITYVDTLTNTEIIGENPESYTVETPDFTLENPTKEGYDFVGWLEKGETEPKKTVTITQGTTGAKLFRLIWTPIDYTISYELDGGVLAEGSPENYNIESEDITLLAPSKTGYTFLGWTGPDVNEPKKDVTIKIGTIGDLTYTAHWTANPYEVEFEANGATSGKMDNQKFTYDVAQKLTENAFVREYVVTFDYNGSGAEKTTATATAAFEGWEDGDKTYEDKQKVSNLATEGTHKLFAKWTLGSVTLPAPERDGYVFAGWTTDKEGLETVEGTTYVPTEDTTLYAQWIANDYSVIFDGNKATSGEMSKQPFTYDVEQALTKNAFDRTYTVYFEGHIGSLEKDSATVSATFNGWALNDKGSKVYDDEAVVKNLTDVKDGEVTLYADWTLNAITLPAPERAGYTFAGWSTSEDGSMGEIFQAGDEFTPKASQTLFAKWKANPYEVEFVGNGATGGEMANQTFTYGKAQNLNENTYVREYVVTFDFNGNGDAAATATAKADFAGWEDGDKVYEDKQEVKNLATEGVHKLFAKWTLGSVELPTPERTGYTFTGWTTDKEGTVAVEGTTYVPTEDTTLYAQWMINKYTAEFDANGGNDADPQSIEKDYDTALGKLPETSRTGYTFNGWFTEAEGGEQITADTKMPVGGATYYAQWTINKHSITFDTTNDSEPVKITKDYGSEVAVVEAPEREGHSFVSWNTKADGTGTEYAPGDKITLTDDVKLYAVWDVNQYTITFKTEGGSDVDPITQDYGTEVQKPADPAKKGYTFAGWDGDIPETMPAEDLTITAKWNINQYTATFDDTEGSGHKETITQDYDTDVTAPEGPDREGYTFLNWNTKTDGTGRDYKPGKTIRLEDENITLYAQWQINQYKITFDANGGSDVDPIELDYNAEVKAPKDPSRYGYVFAGWEPALPEKMPAKDLEVKAQWVELEKYTATFEDHNGNTIGADSGYAGETIKVPADPTREGYTFAGWKPNVPEKFPEANTTYVAQWTANEYKAEFDANGGTKADPESMLKDCDEAFGELPVTTREGYTFQGWFTEKTGGTKITEETTMPAGDVTYYAQWAINTYTIEFDTDGGSAVDKIVQKFGTTIRKPATPSKTGHTFNGWNPAVPETMPAANLKLVAQWLVNQYTIVFNTDGGSKVEPITQGYGTAVTAPENPTKTGYTFAGWNAEIPATMPAGNKLIKAMWQINQYTITFDTAGGSEVAPITQDYGTAVTAPADPVRADYAFTGWDVEVPTTMPADDMKITAQWDYIYTGWKTTDEGTTYFENGKQPYKDEFATIDDVTYYFDEDSYIVKGVTDLEEGIYIFDKETGALIEGDGLYDFDGDLYLLDENKVVENAGLVKIDEDYYFFGEDNKAVKDQIVDVTDAKGYLPEGAYEFGSDGKMINVPVKLTEEIVKLKKDSVEYNGKQQTPTVVVKGFGADAYKVSYKNNIHVGKATVTVTGVEGCFGTVTMHFEITKAKNSWTEKLTMDGWAEGDVPMRPSAEAAFGEVEFGYFADKNCTDEIAVPDTAGTYYVKAFVEGTDDYSGLESKAVKFVIAGDAEDGEGPATGDQNQLALWFSLAMASMAGAFTAYRRRRDEM